MGPSQLQFHLEDGKIRAKKYLKSLILIAACVPSVKADQSQLRVEFVIFESIQNL